MNNVTICVKGSDNSYIVQNIIYKEIKNFIDIFLYRLHNAIGKTFEMFLKLNTFKNYGDYK